MTRACGLCGHEHKCLCSIDGCDRPVEAKTWCKMHYTRHRRHGDPEHTEQPTRDLTPEQRLEVYTDKDEGGCWWWSGAVSSGGYGKVYWGGESQYAHRAWYEHVRGPIPDGKHIDHLCKNILCVNPFHLEPVDPGVNSRRRDKPCMMCRIGATHAWCDTGEFNNAASHRIGAAPRQDSLQ